MAIFCSSAAFAADIVTLSCEVADGANLNPGEQALINIYASTSQATDIYGLDFKIKSSDLTLVASSGTDAQVSASSEFSSMTVAGNVNTGRFILFSMAQNPVAVNGKTLVCTVTVNVSDAARNSATVTLDECYYTSDKDGMNTPAIGPFTSILAVNPPAPKSITLSAPGDITQYQSFDKVQLSASFNPQDADPSVTWTCSDSQFADVDENGLVTVKAIGIGNQPVVTFTATSTVNTSVAGSIELTLKPILPSVMTVTPDNATLIIGDTQNFSVAFLPENAESKDFEAVIADNAVAAITNIADGIITVSALKVGTTTLRVTCTHNSELVKEIPITVNPRLVSNIEVSADRTSIEVGQTAKLTATVTPDNATDKSFTWSSSDNAVATVNADGVVTAVKVGTVTISATANDASGVVGSVEITVTEPAYVNATGINLNFTDVTLSLPGGMIQLEATVLPEECDNEPVKWTSENTSVATVNANGFVTATGLGVTFIYATTVNNDGTELQAFCKVTVVDASGIDAAQANEPVITLTPMTINVAGVADDCEVSVYTLTGQLIASETGRCSVSVANRGIYILKVGSKAVRVSVTR